MKKKLLTATICCVFSLFLISHISTLISFAQAPPVQRDLSVTAQINPKAQDFQFEFATDGKTQVPQDKELEYEITYGARSTAGLSSTNTIVAYWSDERAPDGSKVVEYVIGSATSGYEDSQPVVDMQNRTITWTITDLPPDTIDQKLRFKLRTNSSYSGETRVNFTTRVAMSNQFATMPEISATQSYLYDPTLVPPAPTRPAATVAPTVVPTSTPSPTLLRIQDITFNSITDMTAALTVSTNRPARAVVRFGTSPTALTQTVQTEAYSLNSSVTLQALLPATQYFFKVTATDRGGRSTTSDMMTFTTANKAPAPETTGSAVQITVGGTPILSEILTGDRVITGLIPSDTNYQLTYTFFGQTPVTQLEVIFRDKEGREIRNVIMRQTHDRVFTIALNSGDSESYDIFVRITDPNGFVTEQQIAKLKVMEQLTVLDEITLQPVGDARVAIIKKNSETTVQFTDANGQISLLLSPGKYRAEAIALGYDSKTVDFTIGEADGQEMPTILLKKNLFNISAILQYLKDWAQDTYESVRETIQSLAQSARFFSHAAYGGLMASVGLSFLFFRIRTNIHWRDLIPFFVFNFLVFVKRHKAAYLYGIVQTKEQKPVNGARIEVIDIKTGTVLSHTASNKQGRFTLTNVFNQLTIKLQVSKEGFAEEEQLIQTDTNKLITFRLQPHQHQALPAVRGFQHAAAELFELTLLLTFIAELVFLFTFGIMKTLPFFILSVFNLLLWLFYQRERRHV